MIWRVQSRRTGVEHRAPVEVVSWSLISEGEYLTERLQLTFARCPGAATEPRCPAESVAHIGGKDIAVTEWMAMMQNAKITCSATEIGERWARSWH